MTHRERHEQEEFFKLKITPGAGLCMVKGCRKDGHRHKFSLCHGHYQYRWRMLNPKRSTYASLRDHARGRGIAFTISYDYFLGMTDCISFWQSDAESFGDCPSFDRIDASRGYEPGNLRIITVSQNCRKSQKEKFLPAHVQAVLDRKRERAQANPHLLQERELAREEENPF